MNLFEKWRKWNIKVSVYCHEGIIGHKADMNDIKAFIESPYTWYWLVVPIMGIVAFYATTWQYDLYRRGVEIDRRWKALEKKQNER